MKNCCYNFRRHLEWKIAILYQFWRNLCLKHYFVIFFRFSKSLTLTRLSIFRSAPLNLKTFCLLVPLHFVSVKAFSSIMCMTWVILAYFHDKVSNEDFHFTLFIIIITVIFYNLSARYFLMLELKIVFASFRLSCLQVK